MSIKNQGLLIQGLNFDKIKKALSGTEKVLIIRVVNNVIIIVPDLNFSAFTWCIIK